VGRKEGEDVDIYRGGGIGVLPYRAIRGSRGLSGFPQNMSGRRPIDARRPSGGRSASGAHLCRPPFTATSAGPVGVAEGEDLPGRMRQFCERVLPVPAPHEQQALDLLG